MEDEGETVLEDAPPQSSVEADPSLLLSNLPRTILSTDPLVCTIDDVLTLEECSLIQEAAIARGLEKAKVSSEKSGENDTDTRDCTNVWLPIVGPYADPQILAIAKKLAALVGRSNLTHAENLQVIHYGPGHFFASHLDSYDLDSETGQRCTKNGGQRVTTVLVYLNDVQEGGETCFTELKVSVKPTAGRVTIFNDILGDPMDPSSDMARHPKSEHAAMPVISGEKWACNLWFRQHPVRKNIGANRAKNPNVA